MWVWNKDYQLPECPTSNRMEDTSQNMNSGSPPGKVFPGVQMVRVHPKWSLPGAKRGSRTNPRDSTSVDHRSIDHGLRKGSQRWRNSARNRRVDRDITLGRTVSSWIGAVGRMVKCDGSLTRPIRRTEQSWPWRSTGQ